MPGAIARQAGVAPAIRTTGTPPSSVYRIPPGFTVEPISASRVTMPRGAWSVALAAASCGAGDGDRVIRGLQLPGRRVEQRVEGRARRVDLGGRAREVGRGLRAIAALEGVQRRLAPMRARPAPRSSCACCDGDTPAVRASSAACADWTAGLGRGQVRLCLRRAGRGAKLGERGLRRRQLGLVVGDAALCLLDGELQRDLRRRPAGRGGVGEADGSGVGGVGRGRAGGERLLRRRQGGLIGGQARSLPGSPRPAPGRCWRGSARRPRSGPRSARPAPGPAAPGPGPAAPASDPRSRPGPRPARPAPGRAAPGRRRSGRGSGRRPLPWRRSTRALTWAICARAEAICGVDGWCSASRALTAASYCDCAWATACALLVASAPEDVWTALATAVEPSKPRVPVTLVWALSVLRVMVAVAVGLALGAAALPVGSAEEPRIRIPARTGMAIPAPMAIERRDRIMPSPPYGAGVSVEGPVRGVRARAVRAGPRSADPRRSP